MSITTERTVRELALENPTATRVFEKLGIDYCCGGNKSLERSLPRGQPSVDQVIDSLEIADAIGATGPKRPEVAERAPGRPGRAHQEHSPQVHA